MTKASIYLEESSQKVLEESRRFAASASRNSIARSFSGVLKRSQKSESKIICNFFVYIVAMHIIEKGD